VSARRVIAVTNDTRSAGVLQALAAGDGFTSVGHFHVGNLIVIEVDVDEYERIIGSDQ
jgi:hypothetical protein